MATTCEFAQHLLHRDPRQSSARLALYHYFKNIYPPSFNLDETAIASFFKAALFFNYWRDRSEELYQKTFADLTQFQMARKSAAEIGWLGRLQNLQIVQIKEAQEACSLLKNFFQTFKGKQNFTPLADQRILRVAAAPEQVRVETYSYLFFVNQGQFHPLLPLTELTYDPEMELSQQHQQKLEVSSGKWAYWNLQKGRITGQMISGQCFHRLQSFDQNLAQTAEIFHPLKALEARYIHLNTDPFYVELIGILEKALTLLSSNRAEALGMVQSSLDRGQFALQNIFPHDSRLKNLVWELSSQVLTVRRRIEGANVVHKTQKIGKSPSGTEPVSSPQ